MKNAIFISCLLLASAPAFALPNPVAVIRENLEVKTLISSVEKNRSMKCEAIDFGNTQFLDNDVVKSTVYCNQFDADGGAMANVLFIEFTGYLYGDFFDLVQVRLNSAE